MNRKLPILVLTPGEPAGIGPDIVLMAAQQPWPAELVCVADKALMRLRAEQLGLPIELEPFRSGQPPKAHSPGRLSIVDIGLHAKTQPGVLDPANASYVLATLNLAANLCITGEADALITGPVQKSVIVEGGVAFSGHTEFFAELTDTNQVVMLLAASDLRVALATTHLPLAEVPKAITGPLLDGVIRTLLREMENLLGFSQPRITVLGLNPHAGENGHLGKEEIVTIMPVLDTLRSEGHRVRGPVPADTAFQPSLREETDVYLAMYHDQGLPVLKYASFGEAVNITLGLPFLRTSVDHGTALNLAGTGRANPASLHAALNMTLEFINRKHP